MQVPLLDLKLQYAQIKDEVLRVTDEVYSSQMFILGKRVDEFERAFAAYIARIDARRNADRQLARCRPG